MRESDLDDGGELKLVLINLAAKFAFIKDGEKEVKHEVKAILAENKKMNDKRRRV